MKMAKKQNIQDRINEIYNGNMKIPFMQAKEILLLGYTYGMDDFSNDLVNIASQVVSKQKNSNESLELSKQNNSNESSENIGFVGTTKELIKQTNSLNKEYEKKLKLGVLDAQVLITGRILNYINTHHDVVEMYEFVKQLNDEFQQKYFIAQTNYGEYKSKRK